MAFLTGSNKLIIVLVGMMMVVVLILGVFIGLQFQIAVPVNTTTQRITNADWEGAGATGGVVPGELLDDDDYIASWSTNLIGQRVTFQGAKHGNGIFPCPVDSERYDIYVNTGSEWNLVFSQDVPVGNKITAGWTASVSANWDIRSGVGAPPIPDGSGLRAVFNIHCFAGGWYHIAVDEARIEGGIGNVNWVANQYTVGDVAEVRWEIPYVTDDVSGKGWSLIVESTASGKVTGPVALHELLGTYRYDVTAADFATGSRCRNELVAHLRNELWGKDFDTATVIDATGAGPSVTGLAFSPRSPIVGDTIRLTWSASPNPDTKLALEKIVLKYGFGGIDNELVLPADTREHSLTVGQNGRLHVEVIAYDTGCRPSPTADIDISVGEEPPLGLSFLAILVLIVSVIIGAVVGILAKGLSALMRLILALVPVTVGILLVGLRFV